MANDYYTHTTYPATGSQGSSASMRAELDLVDAGFSKLPSLSGNGGKFVLVNASGTGQTVSSVLTESGGAIDIQGATRVRSDLNVYGTGTDRLKVSPQAAGGGALVRAVNNADSAFSPLIMDGSSLLLYTAGAERGRFTSVGLGLGGVDPTNLLHLRAATNPVVRLESAAGDSGYIDYTTARLQLSAGGGSVNIVAGNTLVAQFLAAGQFDLGTAGRPIVGVGNIGGYSDSGAYSVYAGRTTLNGAYCQFYGGSHPVNPNTFLIGTAGVSRLTVNAVGTVDVAGTLNAAALTGAGSGITSLNASNLASGTVPDARFPATLPAVSGANLTALNASNLATGTIANARTTASSGFGTNTIVSRDSNGDTALRGLVLQNTAVAGNVLDWYEEQSTFTTHALRFGGAGVGMLDTRAGSWTRIGNQLTFTLRIVMTDLGTSTGAATITGLPYAPLRDTVVDVFVRDMLGLTGVVKGFIQAGTTTIDLHQTSSSGDFSAITNSNFLSSATIRVSGSLLI